MSHLLEQVRRTAELLFSNDGSYRKELTKLFKKYHPTADRNWLETRPSNGDWQLCLVSLGRRAENLPFFCQMRVSTAHNDLTQRGHDVSFATVEAAA